MSSDETLANQQTVGGKHVKARISISLAVNVTGTDELSPWFIEKASRPIDINSFRMVWQSNKRPGWLERFSKSTWSGLMVAWLEERWSSWLMDCQLKKQVKLFALVLMTCFAKLVGIDILHELLPNGSLHTKFLFLPANATFICQSLGLKSSLPRKMATLHLFAVQKIISIRLKRWTYYRLLIDWLTD